MNISVADIIGYLFALISLGVTFYFHHKTKLAQKELEHKTEKFEKFAKAIYDISFNKLSELKNAAPDIEGVERQRDSVITVLKTIFALANNETNTTPISEIVHGSHLGNLELSKDVSDVWLISLDLRPDIEDRDLMKNVANSLRRGIKMHYFYADGFVDEPDRLREGILRNLTGYEKDKVIEEGLLNITPLKHKKYIHYLADGEIAIYEFKNSDGRGRNFIGFDEVVFPNERRGSFWQEQLKNKTSAILHEFRKIYENQ